MQQLRVVEAFRLNVMRQEFPFHDHHHFLKPFSITDNNTIQKKIGRSDSNDDVDDDESDDSDCDDDDDDDSYCRSSILLVDCSSRNLIKNYRNGLEIFFRKRGYQVF